MDGEGGTQTQSPGEPRSESEILVGLKRDAMETEETSESSCKRVKLSDLESACPCKDATLDLNVKVGVVSATFGNDAIEESNKLFTFANKKDINTPIDLDLNIPKAILSPINSPFKNHKHAKKSRNDPEAGGSSVGVLGENDPMTVWEGLKQNNYMSARCGIPSAPAQKACGRKKNNNDNDLMKKKKMEPVKKEPVDRFARVAEPSGLLNGLNPGIINHVRNKKQVHSIIEALVGSERSGDRGLESKGADGIENGAGELPDYAQFSRSNSFMGESRVFEGVPLKCEVESKDGVTVASDNASCLSIEGSGNFKSVTSLSFKAANVASQWLELLNQDIRGRLSALRRSKKRVRSVITTDLPDLMSREFSTNHQERDSNETIGYSDAHAARWTTMFGQMDNAISDEEIHLENWLNQVKEMQLHCDSGLRSSLHNASQESDPTGNDHRSGEGNNDNNSDKDLEVAAAAAAAAAASIYSTCNFLLTNENLPCC